MSTTINNTQRTFTASGTFAPYLTMKIETDSKVSAGGAAVLSAQKIVGFSTREVLANGDPTPVALQGGGTVYATLAATTTAGQLLYPAASGKVGVTATSNYQLLGVALQGGVANDVIEILPFAL